MSKLSQAIQTEDQTLYQAALVLHWTGIGEQITQTETAHVQSMALASAMALTIQEQASLEKVSVGPALAAMIKSAMVLGRKTLDTLNVKPGSRKQILDLVVKVLYVTLGGGKLADTKRKTIRDAAAASKFYQASKQNSGNAKPKADGGTTGDTASTSEADTSAAGQLQVTQSVFETKLAKSLTGLLTERKLKSAKANSPAVLVAVIDATRMAFGQTLDA